MISIVQGRVIDVNNDNIVVDLNGLGVQVFSSIPTLSHVNMGENIVLYTYLVVREDALTLYGFDTKEQRDFFKLLLGVSGVGPKSALSILSTLNPDTIHRAVINGQAEVFAHVPGVGKKTAQKIILYLQDRLPKKLGLEPVMVISEVDSEVISALTSLGYSIVEAQRALQSIPMNASQEIEERLKLALQYFTKP